MPLLGIYAASVQKASTAFESIASATGTGSSGTITFSSIPGTYQHLQIRYINKTTSAGESVVMRFNADNASSSYTRHFLRGNGTSATASASVPASSIYVGSTTVGTDTTYPEVSIIDIHDYKDTSKNKTARIITGIDKNGSADINLTSGLWRSTSAITEISIFIGSGTYFTTDSVFALYGIKGA